MPNMEKKNNKLIKRIVFGVNTKTLIITFLVFCFCFQISFSTDISIWPKEIKFNYEPGYSNDAITLKKDNDNYVPVPEWIKGEQENEKCAYIKGQSNRKIQVKFDSNSDNMNFLVKATVITGEGIGEVCEGFISECDLDENRWITLDLNGSLPSSVGIRTFDWKWEATALPMNSPYCPIVCVPCTTTHTYYTLLAAPQDPLDEPWTSVLDYACDWASGQTTASGAATEITESLYESGFYYEASSGYPQYGDSWNSFLLTDFLSDLGSSFDVNCLDMAKAVTTFSNAIGADLTLTRFHSTLGVRYPLNYIDPIGSTSATNNTFSSPLIGNDCRTGGFGYHAFAEDDNNYVWDATLRYDTDANPDNVSNSNPNCGNSTTGEDWELPCYIAESEYLIRLVDSWTKYDNEFIIDCSDPSDCGYLTTNEIYVE